MKIKVTNEIETYPEDDKPTEIVMIKSHWNDEDRVHIIIGSKDLIILGRDLITAIENAMRTGRG